MEDAFLQRHKSDKHETFKDQMNQVFVDLLLHYIPGGTNIVYLDAASGLTTKAVRNLNYKCFVANNVEKVCNELKTDFPELIVQCEDIEKCLATSWSDISFQAAYLDSCAATPEKIIPMLESFGRRAFNTSVPIILGYTMTKRDNKQRTQLNRKQSIDAFFVNIAQRLHMTLLRVHDLLRYKGFKWLDDGVFTEFVLFEPIQKEAIEILKLQISEMQEKFMAHDPKQCEKLQQHFQPKHSVVHSKITQDKCLQVKDRIPGKCCILGCGNQAKNQRSTVCLDESHITIKRHFDGRNRNKKRNHPVQLLKNQPIVLEHVKKAKTLPEWWSKN